MWELHDFYSYHFFFFRWDEKQLRHLTLLYRQAHVTHNDAKWALSKQITWFKSCLRIFVFVVVVVFSAFFFQVMHESCDKSIFRKMWESEGRRWRVSVFKDDATAHQSLSNTSAKVLGTLSASLFSPKLRFLFLPFVSSSKLLRQTYWQTVFKTSFHTELRNKMMIMLCIL